jgi:DNA-binding GntR family transcriptional regulator
MRLPVFGSLPLRKLNGENFKDIIFRACGQAIQKVDLFMRQQSPPEAIAKSLALKPLQLCIALRAVAFLGNGDPVYYQQIFIPPNERELHVVSDSRAPGYLT